MHDIDLMLKLQLEGKYQEAKNISDKLEALGPDKILDPKGQNTQDIWFRHCFNRGWFMLQEGEYQKGCQLLEHGRYLNVYGNPPLMTNAPLFNPNIHEIKGKKFIISLEGGYGDEIIHARFAQSFKEQGADKVYLAAAPELVSIFSRIPGVDGVILRNQANSVAHDYWLPGFSAGWLAGHTYENFPGHPYLTPIPESVEMWKNIIKSDKIKVGIRWAGNPKFEHQQFRRFPEEFLTNLVKYDELQLYSLQRDHNLVQLPEGIVDLQHTLISWEDTMAAIANLDLVITSCTAIAHLAGGMGKETWVITPILPYHTWTYGSPHSDTSPYYDTVKIFRKDNAEKWNGVFQKLYTKLEDKFNLKHVDMPSEDKVYQKLNMGCGLQKFDKCLNVDKSEMFKPDEVVDLEVVPWKWKDNTFDHIIAKDILEHLGDTSDEFIDIMKEMYRVSANSAIWEIQIPHWNCDNAYDDITHKHRLTINTFRMFSTHFLFEKAARGESHSMLAFEHGVDIEVVDSQFDYTGPFRDRLRAGKMPEDELTFALNHFNNVAESARLLIQVHKPPRYEVKDVQREAERYK